MAIDRLRRFVDEDLIFVIPKIDWRHHEIIRRMRAAYQALVLGTRDYIRKCGFERLSSASAAH